jgi:hypothetical protein
MLQDLIDKELNFTRFIRTERILSGQHKHLRDDYYTARQRSFQLSVEYHQILSDRQRALHEYEMASLELRHLQLRRQVASKQHELARLGLLGMDYEHEDNGLGPPGEPDNVGSMPGLGDSTAVATSTAPTLA